MTNREARAAAIAVALPPVVALPLAIMTGFATWWFFGGGILVGWLYLRRRIVAVRGIRLVVFYLLGEVLAIFAVMVALAFFATPW